MARGRFITNGITSDKKINDLSDDTSRLAFTWLITFADCEGRTHGDPAMVRSMLFPRRTDVTIERMEAYLAEWQSAGLVRIYTANGDTWLDFPNFSKHQTGLRKDHEATSTIPPIESGNTTELLRSKDVVETPQIKLSISKDQVKGERKANDPASPVILNELQRLVLVTFNAKRFKNQTQAALVSAWDCYPVENVRAACTWAATKGFGLGQAIASIDKALPKWGSPKHNGNGNGNGNGQQSNALAALERMKERHSNE